MTRERRENVILVALVVSLAVHVGLMFLVEPQVMTQPLPVSLKTARRTAMHVTERVTRPDPVRIAAVEDVEALKDAPAAVGAKGAPRAPAPSGENLKVEVPEVDLPSSVAPEKIAATVFEVRPVGTDAVPVVPILKAETSAARPKASAAPGFSVSVPTEFKPPLPKVPSVGTEPGPGWAKAPAKLTGKRGPKVVFTPAEEVYAKVDEKIVAEEKAAVRQLVSSETAADLKPFVNVTMTAFQDAAGQRYFKVMLLPRTSLKVVPKDVVMVIDGSGSIGQDRFARCRKVARQILRTATNTGDRFNLVVFRNAFSYAFRGWRPCDAESFAAGERWLQRETAHGRTDVFSTISSVLTMPRDPKRPIIALVVTDGDANSGVSDTAEILSKFTALNDGLVSVYMYGVKSSANRELIDVLTHGNRGESFVFEGWRWDAGEGMEALSDRFRDPVLSDLRVVFASGTQAEAYPRLLRNLYRGDALSFVGRVPASVSEVAFSLKGINGDEAYEGFFKLPFATAPNDPTIVRDWQSERVISHKLGQ